MKKIAFLSFIILQILLFSFFSCAESVSGDDITVPEEVSEYLTEDIKNSIESGNTESSFGAASLLGYLEEILKSAVNTAVKPLAKLAGILVILSLLSLFSSLGKNGSYEKLFSYISSLVVTYVVFDMLAGLWDQTAKVMSDLTVMMNGMLPVVTAIYAAGGNISSAGVTNTSMMLILTVIENITNYGMKPVLCVCFTMTMISSVSPGTDLGRLAGYVRKIYTFLITGIMAAFCASLTLSGILAGAADTAALRGVKFAAGSFVPIIGSSVSEAVSAVSTGVNSVRSTVGVLIIAAVGLMTLPLIMSLAAAKFALGFASSAADVLGMDKIPGQITAYSELTDFLIALSVSVTLVFTVAATVFIRTSAAIT